MISAGRGIKGAIVPVVVLSGEDKGGQPPAVLSAVILAMTCFMLRNLYKYEKTQPRGAMYPLYALMKGRKSPGR